MRNKILVRLSIVVIAILVIYGTYWFCYDRYIISTENAYVDGNVIVVSARVSGVVDSVAINTTDHVNAGDQLVMLDQNDAKLAYQKAKSGLAQTVRLVKQLYDSYQQAAAGVDAKRAELAQAELDLNNASALLKSSAASLDNFQKRETALKTAKAALVQSERLLAASRSAIANTSIETHPNVKLAAIDLKNAYYSLKRTEIVSPVSGEIANRIVQVGQQISPGMSLISIVPLDDLWVTANFKETEAALIKPGLPVILNADLYGNSVTYHGVVQGIMPGTGNAFALLPPQNATGNWIKIVQRLPVRIELNKNELRLNPLRLGLTMTVSIDTRSIIKKKDTSKNTMLSSNATSIYDGNDTEINEVITSIIHENFDVVQ